MIYLHVEAVTGHYGVPCQVRQGGVKDSYPTCPPTTMQGFLESLCGEPYQSFQGRFAYGRLQEPSGVGLILRRANVWGSSAQDNEILRTYSFVVYTDPAYCVLVEGPWEDKIKAALDGQAERYGVLYLGESEDLVHWVNIVPEPPKHVEWLAQGQSMALPIKPGRGYNNLRLELANFDYKAGQQHAAYFPQSIGAA